MYGELFQALHTKRAAWRNEEEVRVGWTFELQNALGISFNLERYREDSSYNNVIIEFKDLGLFQGSVTSPKFLEAKNDRLKKYISRAAKRENRPAEDFIGIGIDGNHLFFAQLVDGEIEHGHLLPLSEVSVGMVADALLNNYRRSVTANNLVEDFGLASAAGRQVMRLLADAITRAVAAAGNNKIKMLFREWQALYGQIANLDNATIDRIQRAVGFTITSLGEFNIPATLFVLHTYNSLLIKLLAAEIVANHRLTSYPFFSQAALSYSDADLLNSLSIEIEGGQLFSRAGVKGFVEEAIFSWYLDAAKAEGQYQSDFLVAIRLLLGKLALYRTDDLTAAKSQDVLKQLYQAVVPEALRKSLGEYYTPDWLVNVALDKVAPANWRHVRVLDPTCGSATFLLEVIRRKREAGRRSGATTAEILDDISQNTWGFDLNPLAVQTARVNFLIAIADLLKEEHGHEIELPILLADAVYSPARNPANDETTVRYTIGSDIANLEILLPADLAFERARLDQVFTVMGECVDQGWAYEQVAATMAQRGIADADELAAWQTQLRETYNRVLHLHNQDWNGIWFRIVRNFFWSASAGHFDIVAGNPPWVRWSKLPALYRERAKPTCESYDIFSSTPFNGGNELDISGLITYTVADKWLKPEGDMVFIIPQNHFQVPSSEGFRKFKIDAEYNLVPRSVDDLKGLQPFKGTTNRTAVVVFRKTGQEAVQYPVPYRVWEASAGSTRNIPESLTREEVMRRVTTTQLEANQVAGLGSPWALLRPGRYDALEHLRGECDWVQGRKGVTADLNGLYFVEVIAENARRGLVQIETRPEAGRTAFGVKQQFWIEPGILYPLMKGASDFKACRITRKHNLFAIVPNTGILRASYNEAEVRMHTQFPHALQYLQTFRTWLENRSTYRIRMSLTGAPYYAIHNVGRYTFAPYKVFWAEMGEFRSAVITEGSVPLNENKPYVPDHKLFFADFYEPEPAYYLCGLLNATGVKEYIESHTINLQIGDIFKHMSLPAFDAANLDHVAISQAVRFAHECQEEDYAEALATVRRLGEKILFADAD